MSDNLKYNPKQKSVLLCCGGKACPELYERSKNRVQIRDDDGFIITISKEQARLIPEALKVLEAESKS